LYRARIVVESYSNRARIAIVIGPLHNSDHLRGRIRKLSGEFCIFIQESGRPAEA